MGPVYERGRRFFAVIVSEPHAYGYVVDHRFRKEDVGREYPGQSVVGDYATRIDARRSVEDWLFG
jgi:hypothetical protein